MIEVKNRSVEGWGPLAECDDKTFKDLINRRDESSKEAIKVHLKRQKKLKKYKVTFLRELRSDTFEVMAENEYSVSAAAREYYREHKDEIEFKMQPTSKWAGSYDGYDRLSYVKVRT